MHGCTGEVDFREDKEPYFPPLVNDLDATDFARWEAGQSGSTYYVLMICYSVRLVGQVCVPPPPLRPPSPPPRGMAYIPPSPSSPPLRGVAKRVFGDRNVALADLTMASEDFAFMAQQVGVDDGGCV